MTDPDDTRNMAEHDDSDPAAPFHLRCAEAVEIVTDYLDDALSARDLAVFEAHLADCEGCTIFVDQIAMTIRLTSESGRSDVDVMPANFDQLLDQLRRRADGSQSG
jgi:predicted anti-sigma-YlaC factor YlaD